MPTRPTPGFAWSLTLLLFGCASPEPAPTLAVSTHALVDGRPQPMSDLLGDVWGEDNGVDRKQWLADMHRTAPSEDWRALERANAEAERERRSRGVAAPGEWFEVGSSNQAGHTRSVAVAPGQDGEPQVYLGSANGGLWRGTLDGERWEPLSDGLFGGVDEIVLLGDTLLIRRGSQVFASDDEGATWSAPTGLASVSVVHRMLFAGGQRSEALVLAEDHRRRTVLLASKDGADFELRWVGASGTDADLWVAQVGEREGEEVWAAIGGRVMRSVDRGWTFGEVWDFGQKVTGVHLAGGAGRGEAVMYVALQEDSPMWSLHRGGDLVDWTQVSHLEDFWGAIAVLPQDPEVLMVGGLEAHRSVDGGRTFRRVNAWGQYYGDPAGRLHADVRGMAAVPHPTEEGQDLIWISTDGGTYLSTDQGATVRNVCLNGLGIGQVYSTLTDSQDPDLLLVGTQDQGYQRGRRREPLASGPSTPMDQLLSGDYGYLCSTNGRHELVYSSYPGFILVQEGSQQPELLYPWVDLPVGAEHAWMPPIVADPEDPKTFYLLADRLYRYERKEGPYWTYRPHSTREFTADGGKFLTALAFAAEGDTMFAANDAGVIYFSEDGGKRWSQANTKGAEHLRPTCIAAHPTDPRRAWIGGAGYSSAAVLETTDGGRTWKPCGEGLPRTLVYDLAWAEDGSNEVYAATEAGAWRWSPDRQHWENLMGDAAPATTYWSVEVTPDVVRFGTYGRGVWDFRASQPSSR